MAVLQNTKDFTPARLRSAFRPFAQPETIQAIVLGNDLDSVISGCLLHAVFGWPIAGFYDLETAWVDAERNPSDWVQAPWLAVDLDICQEAIPSVGHHILTLDPDEELPGHEMTLNPNLIRGISMQTFGSKYPLSTAHFLMHALGIPPSSEDSRLLIWLADSAYVNGQSHMFRANVKDWALNCLRDSWMVEDLDRIDTQGFEDGLQSRVLDRLMATDVPPGRGQPRCESRHNRLCGYQFRWVDPESQYDQICNLFGVVAEITGWPAPQIPKRYVRQRGERIRATVGNVADRRLASFLAREDVFSYAFPSRGSINYTTGVLA